MKQNTCKYTPGCTQADLCFLPPAVLFVTLTYMYMYVQSNLVVFFFLFFFVSFFLRSFSFRFENTYSVYVFWNQDSSPTGFLETVPRQI